MKNINLKTRFELLKRNNSTILIEGEFFKSLRGGNASCDKKCQTKGGCDPKCLANNQEIGL